MVTQRVAKSKGARGPCFLRVTPYHIENHGCLNDGGGSERTRLRQHPESRIQASPMPLSTSLFALAFLSATAFLQQDPRIGCVRQLPEFVAGLSLQREGETRRECYVYYVPEHDSNFGLVNVDGRDYRVRETHRRRASAVDRAAGVTRQYDVLTLTPRDGGFEAELWMRNHSEPGWESSEIRGGLTVRKDGGQTTIRVVGGAGP